MKRVSRMASRRRPGPRNDWTIEDGFSGSRMVLHAGWSEAARDEIDRAEIVELELDEAKGWRSEEGVAFLRTLSGLRGLELRARKITGLETIHRLPSLQRLALSTGGRVPIDFEAFPVLEECELEWRAGASSIFAHRGLRRLTIERLPKSDLTAFAELPALASLTLRRPRIASIAGIAALSGLEFLGIYFASRLASIEGLEAASRLRRLELNRCPKLRDITPIRGLRELRRLHLCGNREIASLAPLAGLSKLEVLLFHGSEIADGNLEPLIGLPRLRRVLFDERAGYSRSARDFPGQAPRS